MSEEKKLWSLTQLKQIIRDVIAEVEMENEEVEENESSSED